MGTQLGRSSFRLAASTRRRSSSVFVPADFREFGGWRAVNVGLDPLVWNDDIRHLSRGMYDFPKEQPVLGTLQPSAEAVART